MTKSENMQAIVNKVRELEEKKQTFVTFVDLSAFLLLCEAFKVTVFGGAFSHDMTGQWFYI